MACGRVVRGDVELGPRIGAADVDRRVLPDHPLGPRKAADPEAVDLDELARPIHV